MYFIHLYFNYAVFIFCKCKYALKSVVLSLDMPLYRFQEAERGKSGQRRVPHHLTGGAMLRYGTA